MKEEDLVRQAEVIADEAVAGYDRILAPDVIAEIRRTLIADLLATDDGRASLRQTMADPVVARSEEVGDDVAAKAKASGQSKR